MFVFIGTHHSILCVWPRYVYRLAQREIFIMSQDSYRCGAYISSSMVFPSFIIGELMFLLVIVP